MQSFLSLNDNMHNKAQFLGRNAQETPSFSTFQKRLLEVDLRPTVDCRASYTSQRVTVVQLDELIISVDRWCANNKVILIKINKSFRPIKSGELFINFLSSVLGNFNEQHDFWNVW